MKLRYSGAHQVLHWLTALGMIVVIPLAWLMLTAPENTVYSEALYRWHETVGLLVLALTAYRLILRKLDPPPPLPATLHRLDRFAVHTTYAMFYILMIWLPLTGLLATTALGYPPKLFNIIDTPAMFGADKTVAEITTMLHASAQWPMYGLILLHVAGVIFHLVVTRSGILGRMLPAQATEPASSDEELIPPSKLGLQDLNTDRAPS